MTHLGLQQTTLSSSAMAMGTFQSAVAYGGTVEMFRSLIGMVTEGGYHHHQ